MPISLDDDNEVFCFTVTTTGGKIKFDCKTVAMEIKLRHPQDDVDPSPMVVVASMREHAIPWSDTEVQPSPDAVKNSKDGELFAAFVKASERLLASGKLTGSAPASRPDSADGSQQNSPPASP